MSHNRVCVRACVCVCVETKSYPPGTSPFRRNFDGEKECKNFYQIFPYILLLFCYNCNIDIDFVWNEKNVRLKVLWFLGQVLPISM